MTDVQANSQDLAPTRKSRVSVWVKVLLGVVAVGLAGWLGLTWLFGGPDFDVRITAVPGMQMKSSLRYLVVRSVNDGKLTVRNIVVNDKPECLVPGFKGPLSLALGEDFSSITSCQPVKVVISTDRGDVLYWVTSER